jgi:cell fate (sporulation/competence/biofilm development) regulator YlbF (YheA/YmcA/DUF963 family)
MLIEIANELDQPVENVRISQEAEQDFHVFLELRQLLLKRQMNGWQHIDS